MWELFFSKYPFLHGASATLAPAPIVPVAPWFSVSKRLPVIAGVGAADGPTGFGKPDNGITDNLGIIHKYLQLLFMRHRFIRHLEV